MNWISVKDRLPKLKDGKSEQILVYGKSEDDEYIITKAIFYSNEFDECWESGDLREGHLDVTHWMPLPEPPKEN